MRIKSRLVVAVLAVLCVATMANAGISLSVAPGVDVGDGLLSYTVSLVGTDGDLPVAWDGVFTGPLNQVKVMSFDTPSMSYAMLLPNIAQDTHFLFADSAVTIPAGKAPSETATSLTAAFSYAAPFTSSRLLAQIVLPAGASAAITGQASNGTGVKFDTISGGFAPLPIAVDAGGPYEVGPGQTIQLHGTPVDYFDAWDWDLDGDGQYDDATGLNPNVSYDYLANTLGLQRGTHTIKLEGSGYWDYGYGTATLTLVPEPASLSLLGLGVLGLLRRRR